ncbi:TPA: helix-turn-helix domain-containing protein, partial [Salmonella enterica subsp. enterica serovar Kodjovi]|nr:helix-turn-helix domain-containing protein [Salmonella enterica subsp. enterica serovar Kodjovi]
MEPKYFLLANTHTKTIQGIPFEVIELDRGSLQEMSAELNELNALIKTTTVSLQKISPPELLTAMQGIGRISSKLSGCLAEIQPSAITTAAPSNSCGMTIGDRIQLARENLGMSHDDLAEKLDIHPGGVLAWEDGDDQPMAGMVIPLANALKCDPMWLLTGEGNNANQA